METMERSKRRPRRSFTPEFKADIVERCQLGDRSIGQVARDFDLTETACQRSSNPAVFLSAVQVIQHPDVQVIPHFRGRGSTTWAP